MAIETKCVISDLIFKPFSEKIEVIKTGRSCLVIPDFKSVHKDKKRRIYSAF